MLQAFASFPHLAAHAVQNCVDGDEASRASNTGRAMQEDGTFS
jgi:hypothetical protein